MSETWAELEFVEPEPETDYLSPDGRVKIIVETEHHRGGRDEPPHEIDNYSVFLDEKLVGGAGTEERAREIAIEALEALLEKLADSIRKYEAAIQQLARTLDDSPRSQPARNEPADKLEADQKPKLKEMQNE